MYVDESGDTGVARGSKYFCLSGIVVHETNWRNFVNHIVAYRRVLKTNYGLPIRTEIHATEYIYKAIANIPKFQRLAILRNILDELAKINYISTINIVVDTSIKSADYDVLQNAWGVLFQRFENTLRHGNFPGEHNEDYGMVITDAVGGKKLLRMMRKMSVYNPIPNSSSYGGGSRNVPIIKIIEDPSGRDSKESMPIQMADVVAYFLKQSLDPNSYIRKKSANNYFYRLEEILNKHASRSNKYGIVFL